MRAAHFDSKRICEAARTCKERKSKSQWIIIRLGTVRIHYLQPIDCVTLPSTNTQSYLEFKMVFLTVRRDEQSFRQWSVYDRNLFTLAFQIYFDIEWYKYFLWHKQVHYFLIISLMWTLKTLITMRRCWSVSLLCTQDILLVTLIPTIGLSFRLPIIFCIFLLVVNSTDKAGEIGTRLGGGGWLVEL